LREAAVLGCYEPHTALAQQPPDDWATAPFQNLQDTPFRLAATIHSHDPNPYSITV
jgi:hypothetical protein